MTAQDLPEVAAIEHFIGQKIPRIKLENFNYEYTRLLDPNPKPIFGAKVRPGARARRRW